MKLKSEYIKLTKNTRLYNIDIPIIGLTGGIASGKSTVSEILKALGAAVICADQLVKEIYKSEKALNFIGSVCPQAVEDDILNFKTLRKSFFKSSSLKGKIEKYIYQQLEIVFKNELKKIEAHHFLIYDVPLLFEKELEQKVDCSLLIYAPKEIQIKRVMNRDSIDQELAERIISQQISIEDKKAKASFTIENLSDTEDLRRSVKKFFSSITC